jgi:RNA polymerase sigma-70 factor (ECF subfamily)
MHTTSVSLLQRLRQPGEQQAWKKFVDLYTPLLYYWGRRSGLQEADASDLVQEVLTILVRKLPEFAYDRHKSFRNWLRTITLNAWRARQRRRARTPAEATAADLTEVPAPEDDTFWEVEYREQLVARLLEVMRTDFQPITWKACWESAVNGRSAAAVGAELGLSVGAVRAAKFRVLSRLRQELDGLLD